MKLSEFATDRAVDVLCEISVEDIAVSVACDVGDVVVCQEDGIGIDLIGMVLGHGEAELVEGKGPASHPIEEGEDGEAGVGGYDRGCGGIAGSGGG